MARPASEYPTELELQILKILWDRNASLTVREIRDALAVDGRDLAHTSVITTLGTMVDKGQLEKLDPVQGKAFRFSPLLPQEAVSKKMLGDLVDRVFDGSAEAVMLSLFDVSELDEDELKRLRKLFNQKVRERQS
ncbi:MAG TPA: BlaI/MecI/CopY family transcriptional regulator [Planctomycetaceae bacterium]|nr:BlaI/MecI/CopY family transcriptional regulator [Planctomycetaceae bacterium]